MSVGSDLYLAARFGCVFFGVRSFADLVREFVSVSTTEAKYGQMFCPILAGHIVNRFQRI